MPKCRPPQLASHWENWEGQVYSVGYWAVVKANANARQIERFILFIIIMEDLQGNNIRLIMNRTSSVMSTDPDLIKAQGDITAAVQKQTMISQSEQNTINEVMEAVRDASATENMRAIQDSESQVAQEQKRLVKTLVKKGWSKNEVIYEMQRVYGNDVLILKSKLNDERGALAKFGIPLMMVSATAASLLLFRRGRRRPMPHAAPSSNSAASEKDEILKKLNIKK